MKEMIQQARVTGGSSSRSSSSLQSLTRGSGKTTVGSSHPEIKLVRFTQDKCMEYNPRLPPTLLRSPVGESTGEVVESLPEWTVTNMVLNPVSNPCKILPFGKEEEVKLDPRLFAYVCQRLEITPTVDLFASQ